MSDVPLEKLRDLRDRAEQLLENVDADLRVFKHNKDHLSFRRKPDSESEEGDVNVTTTCSCVMDLALTKTFHDFYFVENEDGSDQTKAQDILKRLVDAPWRSSGLESNNAFTTAMVLRTYGFLVDYGLLTDTAPPKKQWGLPHASPSLVECSFTDIAQAMAKDEENFKINKYPPAVPVMYWFIDGVSRGKIDLGDDLWKKLCKFANEEFNHQRSLVLADHDAMMDPVAMGMAACLCARLNAIVRQKNKGKDVEALPRMPSTVELLHSVREVFKQQTKSGIWPKYFPMFHYQEAGSNFCFTFELLEAILHEFSDAADTVTIANELLSDADIIEKLEKSVTWCEHNRLEASYEGVTYEGWNSGGDLTTLRKNYPESWATAVVHMFLWELKSVLSSHIQRRLLAKYKAAPLKQRPPKDTSLNELLDIELSIEGPVKSLKTILKESLVKANSGKKEADVRREGVKQPMSALLFGPPGTSKTRLTSALAEALGWPLIVINPSDFVKQGFENVFLQANEIFRDINDLSAVVVFFDEMDPLMQSREKDGLDTPSQFLTTSMLPQLTQLHDRGQVIFLVATNYISRFDPALMRAGRFDLLLCMGPPTFNEKLNNLPAFFPPKKLAAIQRDKAKGVFAKYASVGSKTYFQLELYTFHEFKTFLITIGNESDIGDKLEILSKQDFEKLVTDHSERVTLKISDLPMSLWEFSSWGDIVIPDPPDAPNKENEIVKYLRDRKESRKQYG